MGTIDESRRAKRRSGGGISVDLAKGKPAQKTRTISPAYGSRVSESVQPANPQMAPAVFLDREVNKGMRVRGGQKKLKSMDPGSAHGHSK